MDIDDDESIELVAKKFTVPFNLRRVLKEVLGKNVKGHKQMVIAVLKESGPVGFNSVWRVWVDQLHLPDEWPSMVHYQFAIHCLRFRAIGGDNSSKLTEKVVVKFQSLGHFVVGLYKDGLALPLLTDLCANADLTSPPCLICVPLEF
ncbi:hypothetical protein FEM48_Zijuj09G0141100 [Ziziphus jujuba var. spinosa]|uniref:Uncharacterized protein n=1 Tax=Ziziphus jujuba var. spinosa TaxID=714518 RepID=A0A978UTE9_ZIZJJ|nr:hypothetical protein FEM48_Zijuj09G0141100 [Ziziphus jujuba var. spinosa]